MHFIDKKNFFETYAILKKEKQMLPVFCKMKDFVEENFSINILNVKFEKIRHGIFNVKTKNYLLYGKKFKLIFYVLNIKEFETMKEKIEVLLPNGDHGYKLVNNNEKQTAILDYFCKVAKDEKFDVKVDKQEVWIDYYFWFSSDYMSFIANKVEKDITKEVIHKYANIANIWRIQLFYFGIYIFYEKNVDVINNESNGISNSIKEMYWDKICKIDEFKYYKKEYIVFYSKENIDKNYSGNLFYYFK